MALLPDQPADRSHDQSVWFDAELGAYGAAVVPEAAPLLAAELASALADCHVAVNDVSGGNVALRLQGAATRDLFAKGCTLDFHPDVFGVGQCAQSGLGKAAVLFGQLDDAPTFELIVRRSFAGYLVKWLHHAGREYGIEFA